MKIKNPKIVAIIQARMGSTRLPGKVMLQIEDKTVLGHVLTRVLACPEIDQIVVATTTLPQDDVIEKESEKYKATCFRGSEGNVLERYYLAAKTHSADIIIRITSDCPLIDPSLISKMLHLYCRGGFQTCPQETVHYLSNRLSATFPRGLDTEIMTFATLEKTFQDATRPYEKEHVTPYIYEHPEIFSLKNYASKINYSGYRWTLDTREDFELIKKIYAYLYKKNHLFLTEEILELLQQHPELKNINAHIEQKAYK